MIVYRPIKTNYLSQKFGENLAMAKLDDVGKAIRPFVVKSIPLAGVPEGWAELYPLLGLKGHNGYDSNTWHGEPLYFPVDCKEAGGWWSKNASDLDGGLGVDVISKKTIMLNGRRTYVKFRFWHLKEGIALDEVKFGQLIGFCDNTGASSGDHLHWSLKPCAKDGTGKSKNNGYYGAEDFSEFYENTFVLDVMDVKARALTAIDLAHKVILQVRLFIKNFNK